jgi:hypothetical protein
LVLFHSALFWSIAVCSSRLSLVVSGLPCVTLPPSAKPIAARALTKLTGNVIAALSAQVRHLVDVGLVEPDKLRLTIEARRFVISETASRWFG